MNRLLLIAAAAVIAVMPGSAWSAARAGAEELATATATATATETGGAAAQIRRQVEAALPPGLALLEVRLPATLEAVRGDTASVTWLGAPHAGRQSVLAVVAAAGREAGRGFARLRVGAVRPVLVARRQLVAGEAVAPGDLGVESRPVDGNVARVVEPAALVGATVSRAVAAGAVVGAGDVVPPVPVAQGTPVRVSVRRPGLVVGLDGVLDRAARLGDVALVRVAGADRRLVRGRLVDRASVVVDVDRRAEERGGATP